MVFVTPTRETTTFSPDTAMRVMAVPASSCVKPCCFPFTITGHDTFSLRSISGGQSDVRFERSVKSTSSFSLGEFGVVALISTEDDEATLAVTGARFTSDCSVKEISNDFALPLCPPCSRRNAANSSFLYNVATSRGVPQLLTLPSAFTSAPFSNRTLATAILCVSNPPSCWFSLCAATCRGVLAFLNIAFASAPCFSNNKAKSLPPFDATPCRGVYRSEE